MNRAIDILKIRTREQIDEGIASGQQVPDYVYVPMTIGQMSAISERVRSEPSKMPDYAYNLLRKYQK